MGLFDFFKKKTQTQNVPKDNCRNSFGEDMRYLTADGDLPWGWYTANADFTGKIGAEYKYFFDAWYESRGKSPRETYAALKSFVLYMNDAKKLCHSMGECFEYWLGDCFTDEYLSERTKELNCLEQNLPALEADYEKKIWFENSVLPSLEKDLLAIVKENPGVLQKDIYKMFDPMARSYIQEKLYFCEKSGSITREKSGNTYKLFVK